jgi:hypothetical protein
MEHAQAYEPIQAGRIYIEKLRPPPFGDRGTPAEYRAGLDRAISLGWLEMHDSGTFVKLTPNGADLFACAGSLPTLLRKAALIVCRDQSDSFITPPNLNAVTTYIAASLDQGGIIALAFDDPWRSVQAIISIDLIKAISDHVRRPL